ncbi:unnamed protein product [Phaeothamnion confervicola]
MASDGIESETCSNPNCCCRWNRRMGPVDMNGEASQNFPLSIDPRLARLMGSHHGHALTFAYNRIAKGEGCVLAGYSGPERTVMATAFFYALGQLGLLRRVVIVCPENAVGLWEADIGALLQGDCSCLALSDASKDYNTAVRNADAINTFLDTLNYRVLIISFDVLRRQESQFTTRNRPSRCDLLICDEAQQLFDRRDEADVVGTMLGAIDCRRQVLLSARPLTVEGAVREFMFTALAANPDILKDLGSCWTEAEDCARHVQQGRRKNAQPVQVQRADRIVQKIGAAAGPTVLTRPDDTPAKPLCDMRALKQAWNSVDGFGFAYTVSFGRCGAIAGGFYSDSEPMVAALRAAAEARDFHVADKGPRLAGAGQRLFAMPPNRKPDQDSAASGSKSREAASSHGGQKLVDDWTAPVSGTNNPRAPKAAEAADANKKKKKKSGKASFAGSAEAPDKVPAARAQVAVPTVAAAVKPCTSAARAAPPEPPAIESRLTAAAVPAAAAATVEPASLSALRAYAAKVVLHGAPTTLTVIKRFFRGRIDKEVIEGIHDEDCRETVQQLAFLCGLEFSEEEHGVAAAEIAAAAVAAEAAATARPQASASAAEGVASGASTSPLAQRLEKAIESDDLAALERLHELIIGAPGYGEERKKAKLHIKRLKSVQREVKATAATAAAATASDGGGGDETSAGAGVDRKTAGTGAEARSARPAGAEQQATGGGGGGGVASANGYVGLARPGPNDTEFYIPIHSGLAGWIIGPRGENVQGISRRSGAYVKVVPGASNLTMPQRVRITGTPEAVAAAFDLVEEDLRRAPSVTPGVGVPSALPPQARAADNAAEAARAELVARGPAPRPRPPPPPLLPGRNPHDGGGGVGSGIGIDAIVAGVAAQVPLAVPAAALVPPAAVAAGVTMRAPSQVNASWQPVPTTAAAVIEPKKKALMASKAVPSVVVQQDATPPAPQKEGPVAAVPASIPAPAVTPVAPSVESQPMTVPVAPHAVAGPVMAAPVAARLPIAIPGVGSGSVGRFAEGKRGISSSGGSNGFQNGRLGVIGRTNGRTASAGAGASDGHRSSGGGGDAATSNGCVAEGYGYADNGIPVAAHTDSGRASPAAIGGGCPELYVFLQRLGLEPYHNTFAERQWNLARLLRSEEAALAELGLRKGHLVKLRGAVALERQLLEAAGAAGPADAAAPLRPPVLPVAAAFQNGFGGGNSHGVVGGGGIGAVGAIGDGVVRNGCGGIGVGGGLGGIGHGVGGGPIGPGFGAGMATENECIVCLCAEKNALVMPCRHCCCCGDCADLLMDGLCPLCRQPYTDIIKGIHF